MKYLVILGPSSEAHERLDRDDSNVEETTLEAFDYYDDLQKKKKLEHYVRMDGPPGSVLIYDVDSPEEFAQLRAEDPLSTLVGDNVKIIPLGHPKAARGFMHKTKERKARRRAQKGG